MTCTINPFIAYVDLLIAAHTADPSVSYTTLMTDVKPFELIGDKCDICISDCGNFAFLGPMIDIFGNDQLYNCYNTLRGNFPTQCCENYDISNINAFDTHFADRSATSYYSELCCNSFNNCAPAFTNLMQKYLFSNNDGIFDEYVNGIHEYGTIKGDSSLCLLNAKIQAFSDADKLDFLNGFYTRGGFVMFFDGTDTVYAGTAQGFLSWY
jgi:hypothetical protein